MTNFGFLVSLHFIWNDGRLQGTAVWSAAAMPPLTTPIFTQKVNCHSERSEESKICHVLIHIRKKVYLNELPQKEKEHSSLTVTLQKIRIFPTFLKL